MKILSKISMVLLYIFLYAPIAILILFSFNSGRSTGVFEGFSLYWYKELFRNGTAINALLNTIELALCAAIISTVIGTAAAAGISKFRSRIIKGAVKNVTDIPMMNPDIVTGISMMLLFVFIGRAIGANSSLSFVTLLIAHVTFCLPYVITSVLPKFSQMDKNLPEAALDLGCSPMKAFIKVEIPQIMPGIFTGFIMALTLSIDDFVISHFTGSGFQTLPLFIFSMTKRTVKPDMYALSTLIFVTILILMIIANLPSLYGGRKKHKEKSKKTKKVLCALLAGLIVFGGAFAVFNSKKSTDENIDYTAYAGTTLYVYNWGEYISDGSEDTFDTNSEFEALTGIKVVYETFDSNESMYTKLKAGGTAYDVIIPSDYMIGKLIEEDMLEPIDFNNVPNYQYIPEQYRNLEFDPANEYSVPYTFGRVGIIYNKTMVDEEDAAEESWSLLFNPKYSGKILQFNNPRDAFATAQFYQGNKVNSTDTSVWDSGLSLLREQKGILQGYVMDEIFNKMESGETAIAPYYLGDFFTMYAENEDLAFYHPKEGTNFFVDSMCIPKGSNNKSAAELYINYMLDPDVALANAEYICYGCPHSAVIENEEYAEYMSELHPDAIDMLYGEAGDVPTEIFLNLDKQTNAYLNSCWEKLKTESASQSVQSDGEVKGDANKVIYIICCVIVALIFIFFIYLAIRKYKRRIID